MPVSLEELAMRRAVVRKDILFFLLAMVGLCGVTVFMTLQGGQHAEPTPPHSPPYTEGEGGVAQDVPKDQQKVVKKDSGLEYVELRIGSGGKVGIGSVVKVIYTGTLRDGKQFDSNVGKDPYEVTVGEGRVIQGWEEGLQGMRQGGKRKLIIPYKLAYGEAGRPPRIPPKADLIFQIEVVKVTNH
jgi:FKBP-type peptidyl-prolyl cis-trans isomerase